MTPENPRSGATPPTNRDHVHGKTLLLGGSGILLASAIGFALMNDGPTTEPHPAPRVATARASSLQQPADSLTLDLPAPDLIKPLSPAEAAKANAERPVVARPDQPAKGFELKTDATDQARAVDCLTQAVYYEAASEGVDGGRAVAQVVLNRVRHPGFPGTVCGVVYQGSERPTGCQFSFTCDGSLLRTPTGAIWQRSRKIAEKALAGDVFAPIGHATHYHADYVVPYWADSLDKTVQIGRHIFYRLKGSLGDARLFSKSYGGPELVPAPVPTDPALLTDNVLKNVGELASADQTIATGGPPPERTPEIKPRADSEKGALLADETAIIHRLPRRKTSDCPASSEGAQLKPMRPQDLESGSDAPTC